MPVQLTPAQAADPQTIERVACAEFTYDEIVSGRWDEQVTWWTRAYKGDAAADRWRAKARELLTELVEDHRG